MEDKRMKALEFFKDWSNYLLVTTVAALGWASTEKTALCGVCESITIWSLAVSVCCGFLTRSAIPLVAEGLNWTQSSFYLVKGRFKWFVFWGREVPIKIKWVCFPQHLAFLIGIIAYAIGVT